MYAGEKREALRECPVCGEDFEVSGKAVSRRKYCSDVCRDKYYRDQSKCDVNLTDGVIVCQLKRKSIYTKIFFKMKMKD